MSSLEKRIVMLLQSLHLGVLFVLVLSRKTSYLKLSVEGNEGHVAAGSRRVLSGAEDMRDGSLPLTDT
jgi:hypothetical protein